MGKSKIIGIVIALALVLGVGIAVKHKKDQSAAAPVVDELFKVCEQDRISLESLYQKRLQVLVEWEKAVRASTHPFPKELELSAPVMNVKDNTLKTQNDFNRMDIIQNMAGEDFTHYFQSKIALKKRPVGFEKLDEEISRKRHEYHTKAFEANSLIQKTGLKRDLFPVCGAEKLLYEQGLWK